jgi:hypothetical protein
MRKLLFTGVTKNSAGIEALKALKHQGVQRVCTVSCDSAVMPYALIHCKVTQRDCVLDDIWWLSKTIHFLLHLCTSLDFTQVTSSNCPSFVQLGFSLRISKTGINTRLRERERNIYIYITYKDMNAYHFNKYESLLFYVFSSARHDHNMPCSPSHAATLW